MKIAQLFVFLLLVITSVELFAKNSKELEIAAAKGDLDAMFELGSIALLKHEYHDAQSWLKKASDKKHAPSLAALGFMYFNGFACEKDPLKARELYERSAKAGAHQGLNNLAHLYRYGLAGLEKDLDKAVKLLESAAEKGNVYAVNTLSSMYRSHELGAPNIKKTLEWLEFGAKRNYSGCLSDLGYAHEHGLGVRKNSEKAVAYYQKAIALGSSSARSNLGYMFLMGNGVERDYSKALGLFTKAAQQEHVGGMINLAVMKYNGLGIEKDSEEAFALLRRASDQGNVQAGQILKEWKAKEDVSPKK